MSVIQSDLQSDNQAGIQTPATDPGSGRQPFNSIQGPILGKDQSGDHSTIAAESISPRYSSQQSQSTTLDWEGAEAGEVSSRALHPEPTASNSSGAITEQQGTAAAAQPGSIEHDVFNMDSNRHSQLLSMTYQGKVSDDPAKEHMAGQPRLGQESVSRSGQQACAMADDVKGMAPNPGSSMIGEEGGGRPWLKRAFSMVQQENMGIDMNSPMDSLDKVAFCCSSMISINSVDFCLSQYSLYLRHLSCLAHCGAMHALLHFAVRIQTSVCLEYVLHTTSWGPPSGACITLI